MVDEIKQAIDKACDLLRRREHARAELTYKLSTRGFSGKAIEAALGWLDRYDYLSDERYTQMRIRYRANQGFGPIKICSELAMWSIPESSIYHQPEWIEQDWVSSACMLIQRRFQSHGEGAIDHVRCYRYLQQRGFTHSQIKEAINQVEYES